MFMDASKINHPNVNADEIKSYQKSYLKCLLVVLGVVIVGSGLWLYFLI